MTHDIYNDKRNIKEAVSQWDSSIEFGRHSNTYALVRALLTEADRIDDDLEDVYHSHHINFATGDDLDKFGELVNAPRKTDEPDDKYRTRIKAQFAQARTNTDFNSFVEFCSTVLNTDIDNLFFETNYAGNPATVVLSADKQIFTQLSLTATEIADIIGGGIPAGHEVQVQERGTFELKSDGDTDDASKGLTSDNISTGGTLATDII